METRDSPIVVGPHYMYKIKLFQGQSSLYASILTITKNEENLIPGQVSQQILVQTNQSADSRMTGRPRACAVAHFWYQEYGSVLSPVGGNTP